MGTGGTFPRNPENLQKMGYRPGLSQQYASIAKENNKFSLFFKRILLKFSLKLSIFLIKFSKFVQVLKIFLKTQLHLLFILNYLHYHKTI